jgi:hypothetical protein
MRPIRCFIEISMYRYAVAGRNIVPAMAYSLLIIHVTRYAGRRMGMP